MATAATVALHAARTKIRGCRLRKRALRIEWYPTAVLVALVHNKPRLQSVRGCAFAAWRWMCASRRIAKRRAFSAWSAAVRAPKLRREVTASLPHHAGSSPHTPRARARAQIASLPRRSLACLLHCRNLATHGLADTSLSTVRCGCGAVRCGAVRCADALVQAWKRWRRAALAARTRRAARVARAVYHRLKYIAQTAFVALMPLKLRVRRETARMMVPPRAHTRWPGLSP